MGADVMTNMPRCQWEKRPILLFQFFKRIIAPRREFMPRTSLKNCPLGSRIDQTFGFRDHGLKLVLTVSPFVSTESKNFAPGVSNHIFVGQRKADDRVPALTWYKVSRPGANVMITIFGNFRQENLAFLSITIVLISDYIFSTIFFGEN
jgi:hypothetical protein